MKYLYTFLLLVSGFTLYSQCGLSKTYSIEDLDNEQADTTNVSILVDGAANNNLATIQQGVCGVQLKFSHPFMKELFIELIAPSGQKITLVGGDIVATNTPFITWDVTFVECSSAANPDTGFEPRWENDQLWQSFSNYNGQYYPHLGCLEDFNSGTVNGNWTIRCIDFVDGGKGKLLDAKILFCQDQGVSCGECTLDPGVIHNQDIFTCQGDTTLNVILDKTYPLNLYNPSDYDYTNVIFNENKIFEYTNITDFRSYSAGRYTICGLQVSKLQTNLPNVGMSFDQYTLDKYFFELGACAAVSTECMVIDISTAKDPVTIDAYLCQGENYIIDGKAFDSSGSYEVLIENGACDSLIQLNLTVIDILANIKADRDSISCNGNTIALEGSNQGTFVNDLTYRWFTNDGMLAGDPSFYIIDAVQEGHYYLEVTGITPQITCKDTVVKEIFPDRTFPVINFENKTINCANDTVLIKIDISRATQNIQWSSKNASNFIETTEGIRVWAPDVYYISVLADNGCSVLDSVEVLEDKYFELPIFTSDTLDCRVDSVAINVSLLAERNYTFSWVNVKSEYNNSPKPYVFSGGTYLVTITDTDNGCSGITSVEVQENRITPEILSLQVDTINCNFPAVIPEISIDQPVSEYLWSGLNFTSTDAAPSITKQGIYDVKVVVENTGCVAMSQFEVFKDTLLPNIIFEVDSLTCNIDSLQIFMNSDKNLLFISWVGPENFKSNDAQPFVKTPGLYVVTFSGSNGCSGANDVLVPYGLDIPEVVLPGDSLKCGLDTIKISVLPKSLTYSYFWSGPGLLENNVMSPLVREAGLYSVTVTDDVTGCTAKYYTEIVDDRNYTVAQINVGTLDCAKDSVQIILSNTDLLSVVYTGPNFYSESFSPFVHQVGTYHYTIINAKNCKTSGSIDVISNDEIPILDKVFSPFKCGQDSILLEGKSNLAGTNFTWSGPNGFTNSSINVYAFDSGNYTLTGIAPNGCKSFIEFEVGYDTLPPIFEILPFGELTCMQETISLSTNFPIDAGQILWTNGFTGPSLDVTTSGTYTATAIGNNQCNSTQTVIVTENRTYPTFTTTASVINCKDLLSTIAVKPTSAYSSIKWRNDINPTSVADGTLIKNTSFPGLYQFNVANLEGCVVEGSIEVVTDVEKPTALEIFSDTISCNNLSIDIGVQIRDSVLEYLWNGPDLNDFKGSNLLRINAGGQYYLKVTGANYCASSFVFDIVKDDDIPQYSLFSDTLTCDKGKINIGVNPLTPNLEYFWSGPNAFMNNVRSPKVFDPGLYIVTITGENGCFLIDSITVFQDIAEPTVVIADTLYLPCDSSAITLSVSSDTQILRYNWIFPDGSLVTTQKPTTNLVGNYRVQIAGQNGCGSKSTNFYVTIDKTPPGFTFQTDTINCSNPNATLIAQSQVLDVSYYWKSPSGTEFSTDIVNTAEGGTFLLIVSDKNKCKDSIFVTVPVDTLQPTIDIIKVGEIQCTTKFVTLDATTSGSGNQVFANWSTIDGNITDRVSSFIIALDKAGTYKFELNNLLNGCKNDTLIVVADSPQQFTLLETEANAPSCKEIQNGSIAITTLNGVPPFTVEFSGTNRGSQTEFSNLNAGIYDLIVTDSLGCKQQQMVTVPEAFDLNLLIDKVIEIKFGDSVLLKPIYNIDPSGLATLRWFKRDSLLCDGCTELWVRPFLNSFYNIEYSVNGFCKEEVAVLVKVSNDIEKAIPNVFRPLSNDGNDYFFIPQVRGIERINSMFIFDRWAENVFKATNIASGDKLAGWNGTFRGEACQMGIYVVIAELLLSDGTIWTYKGDVLLIY